MASAIIFCPRPELSNAENLRGFIESSRSDLNVFGKDLPFDENVWDITESLQLKGRGKKRVRIYFTDALDAKPFPEPFLSFAKAYFRYMFGLRPTKSVHSRLFALRALSKALRTEAKLVAVEELCAHVMDTAANIIHRRYDAGLAYRIGRDIEDLGKFVSENRFSRVPVRWTNTLSRPSDSQRVGRSFDERRAAKMPTSAALEALPKIFNLATEPGDLIVSSVAAILLAAPSRISEVLMLPTHCEVWKDESRVLLRWWPSKGAPPMLKPVYSGMSDVVREAIEKLSSVSAPARRIASWYEDHPNDLFLVPGTEYLREKRYLSLDEVATVIGVTDGRAWCNFQGIDIYICNGRSSVLFKDLERSVISLLPPGFPFLNKEIGLRYSEALILVRKNELHSQRATFNCMIEPIPTDAINVALGAKDRPTIFDKFGFSEPGGGKIKITTHQFRHYLNTIAQLGGLSQLEIAKWSGRADVRQNAAYDHVSSEEMLAQIREAVGDDSLIFGPLGSVPDERLITRQEFARLKVPTAHVTEFGFCVHDFSMTPCQLHRDCINCEELVCIKGDCTRTANLNQRLVETRLLLASAEDALRAHSFGADRWVEHHRASVERLEQLCSMLEDPAIPSGTFITQGRSEVRQLTQPDDVEKARTLQLIRKNNED